MAGILATCLNMLGCLEGHSRYHRLDKYGWATCKDKSARETGNVLHCDYQNTHNPRVQIRRIQTRHAKRVSLHSEKHQSLSSSIAIAPSLASLASGLLSIIQFIFKNFLESLHHNPNFFKAHVQPGLCPQNLSESRSQCKVQLPLFPWSSCLLNFR